MRAQSYLSAAAALGVLWAMSSPAATQNQAQDQTGTRPSAQTEPSAISDRKLDAEASAVQHVSKIQEDYRHRMATAAPGDQQRIAAEANQAAEKAVKDQGLSVDEYRSILQVAQNDPVVRQKLVSRINSGP